MLNYWLILWLARKRCPVRPTRPDESQPQKRKLARRAAQSGALIAARRNHRLRDNIQHDRRRQSAPHFQRGRYHRRADRGGAALSGCGAQQRADTQARERERAVQRAAPVLGQLKLAARERGGKAVAPAARRAQHQQQRWPQRSAHRRPHRLRVRLRAHRQELHQPAR